MSFYKTNLEVFEFFGTIYDIINDYSLKYFKKQLPKILFKIHPNLEIRKNISNKI